MRELKITPSIAAGIKRVNGGAEIDLTQVAVFESRSLNTRPLRRRSGLFAGAVTSRETLDEMAAHLNASVEGLPLHIMHNTELLNVGRLFAARVDQAADGAYEISSQFYLPRTEEKLIANINTGITDQVSIGITGRKLECSSCGFDFKAGGPKHIMSGVCDHGHEIGVNAHVNIIGLDQWVEQSIVDTGASEGSRIVANDQSRFDDTVDHFYRMAARNHQNDSETFAPLIANLTDILSEEIPTVDKTELEGVVAAALTAHNEANATALAAKQAEVDAAVTRAQTAETELAAAKAAVDTDAAAKLTAAEKVAEDALAYLKDQALKAQAAAGVKAPVEAPDVATAITLINASGLNLVNLFAKDHTPEDEGKGEIKLNSKDVLSFAAFQARKD